MRDLSQAILEVESWFTLHAEVGFAESYTDQRGKAFGAAETRDMDTAPTGEPYVVVVSGGIWTSGVMPMMFHDEDDAVHFWLYAIEDYAETVAKRGQWKSLHLYWRERPLFERQTYVALDQAGMLRDRLKLASQLTVDMGIVWSRLLISKLDPDGKEETDAG